LEEALRWRKYPEERPEVEGTYVIEGGFLLADWRDGIWWKPYPWGGDVTTWLPIPPTQEEK
jgi:hypothetical protein